MDFIFHVIESRDAVTSLLCTSDQSVLNNAHKTWFLKKVISVKHLRFECLD